MKYSIKQNAKKQTHTIKATYPLHPLLTAHWTNQLDKAGELAQVYGCGRNGRLTSLDNSQA